MVGVLTPTASRFVERVSVEGTTLRAALVQPALGEGKRPKGLVADVAARNAVRRGKYRAGQWGEKIIWL